MKNAKTYHKHITVNLVPNNFYDNNSIIIKMIVIVLQFLHYKVKIIFIYEFIYIMTSSKTARYLVVL